MHGSLNINRRIVPVTDATLSSLSSAALFGNGIFSTLAIRKGSPLLWDKHWRRISNNSEKLGLHLTEHTKLTTRAALEALIEKNQIINGRARITFFDESPSQIWPTGTASGITLNIITGDVRPVPENFRLTASPYPINSRSPLAGIKSCNYLENILAIDEAKSRGFHEAVRTNERGHITSGCMANVFWLRQNRLFTPSLSTGCLPGTTREYVLENLKCEEVEAGIDELNSADAIFLTSAGLGIVEVAEYGSTQFNRSDHPSLSLLNNLH